MHNSGPLWTTSGKVLSFTIHPPSLPRRRATCPHLATWVFVVPQVAGAGCCGGSGGVTGMTEISDLHSCNYTAVENSVDTVDSRAGGPVSGGLARVGWLGWMGLARVDRPGSSGSARGRCAGSGLVRAREGSGNPDSARGRLGSRPFRRMHRLFVSRRDQRSILTWENADRASRDDTKSRVRSLDQAPDRAPAGPGDPLPSPRAYENPPGSCHPDGYRWVSAVSPGLTGSVPPLLDRGAPRVLDLLGQ